MSVARECDELGKSVPREIQCELSRRVLPLFGKAPLMSLPEDVERGGAFHSDLGVSLIPLLVRGIVSVPGARRSVVHFHAHTVLAAGSVALERSRQLAVPNAADAFYFFRKVVSGFVERIPIGLTGSFDWRESKAMHQFLFTGGGCAREQ